MQRLRAGPQPVDPEPASPTPAESVAGKVDPQYRSRQPVNRSVEDEDPRNPTGHAESADGRDHPERLTSQNGEPHGYARVPLYADQEGTITLSSLNRTVQRNPLLFFGIVGLGTWAYLRFRAA